MTFLRFILTLTAIGALPALARDFREEFDQTYPLEQKGRLEVDNLNGSVRISTWERNEVKVEAVKKAKIEAHLKVVTIEVDSSPERLFIKSKYPNSKKNNSTSIDYTITVPKNCELKRVKTVNGGIHIVDVQGDVEASSVNGTVRAAGLAGETELSTINGSVKASLVQFAKPVSLKAVNGTITLALPPTANAEVFGTTTHGRITSDFPLQPRKEHPVGQRLDGKLGDGGPRVRLSTVNGGISLKEMEVSELEEK